MIGLDHEESGRPSKRHKMAFSVGQTSKEHGSGILARFNGLVVFAFPALLTTIAWGYAYIPLVALPLSLLSIGCWRGYRLDWEDAAWCFSLGGYGLSWSAHDWLTTGTLGSAGLPLSLWPFLAIVVLIGLRGHAPRAGWLWGGILCGALVSAVIAIYERVIIGAPRAGNDMNAIVFGNLSLLLGLMSLSIATAWLAKRRESSHSWLLLAWIAGMAGLLASILSGTRGGWLVIPIVLWVFYLAYSDLFTKRFLQGVGAIIVIITVLILSVPHFGVTARIQQAIDDTTQYIVHDKAQTSVGVRLDMWKGGWWLFLEKPWVGWGEGGLELRRDHYVAQGKLTSGVSSYDQLHSDIIDTTARRGMVGLLFLGCLYVIPFCLFWRRLSHPAPELRALALVGVLVPIAFIGFGLTQSMLRDVRGLSGYLGLAIVIWAVLKQKEQEYEVTHKYQSR